MGFDLITPMHLLFLAIAGLLLLGPKRLPDMGRSLGTGIREFKSSVTGTGGIAASLTSADEPAPAGDDSSA